jgi:uncharacterized repeat protein (TIGR03843 family)
MGQVDKATDLKLLKKGQIELVGQFMWGSNHTLLVNVNDGRESLEAVYKPQRGERPLWDFPAETLAGREVAAYLVSEALGWNLVPHTVFREDGPLGPGSLQLRVDHDPEQHYFTFNRETRERLRPVALFDLLINNADRKAGHILLDAAGKIWLIDHGISFHAEPKLRTVIWDFVGEVFSTDLLHEVEKLELQPGGQFYARLAPFLSPAELEALEARRRKLMATGCYPAPPEGERAVPWPPV